MRPWDAKADGCFAGGAPCRSQSGTLHSQFLCLAVGLFGSSRHPRNSRLLQVSRKASDHLPGDAPCRSRRCCRQRSGRRSFPCRAHASPQGMFAMARARGLRPGMPEPDRNWSRELPRLEYCFQVVRREELFVLQQADRPTSSSRSRARAARPGFQDRGVARVPPRAASGCFLQMPARLLELSRNRNFSPPASRTGSGPPVRAKTNDVEPTEERRHPFDFAHGRLCPLDRGHLGRARESLRRCRRSRARFVPALRTAPDSPSISQPGHRSAAGSPTPMPDARC